MKKEKPINNNFHLVNKFSESLDKIRENGDHSYNNNRDSSFSISIGAQLAFIYSLREIIDELNRECILSSYYFELHYSLYDNIYNNKMINKDKK